MVFLGQAPSGKKLGIYVEAVPEPKRRRVKEWKFTILGKLICSAGTVPSELIEVPDEFIGGEKQRELLAEVERTRSASS